MISFYAAHGHGPWDCFFCVLPVLQIGRSTWDGNVHHIDEDVENDEPSNLTMTHVLCHRQHHGVSDAARAKLSAAFIGRVSPTKGMTFSAEVNAKKAHPGSANHQFGKPLPTSTRQAISEANRRKILCDRCGINIAQHWLRRHQDAGCRPKKIIVINGVERVRGKENKIQCTDCDKPYAERWMKRHKDAGKCV